MREFLWFFPSFLTNVVLLMFWLLLGRMESQEEDYFWNRKMQMKSIWILERNSEVTGCERVHEILCIYYD